MPVRVWLGINTQPASIRNAQQYFQTAFEAITVKYAYNEIKREYLRSHIYKLRTIYLYLK